MLLRVAPGAEGDVLDIEHPAVHAGAVVVAQPGRDDRAQLVPLLRQLLDAIAQVDEALGVPGDQELAPVAGDQLARAGVVAYRR